MKPSPLWSKHRVRPERDATPLRLGGHLASGRFEATNIKHMGMGQNLVPLVNLKIAGKWMFIPLKMVLIGIDP
jgi:hypothetical protein